jgi:hypothetical protein
MTGDVKRRNTGVKLKRGSVMDRSERLMALIYKSVARMFNPPPTSRAIQNSTGRYSGIGVKKIRGKINGRLKTFQTQEMVKTSKLLRDFLQRPSLKASQTAVRNERIIHI